MAAPGWRKFWNTARLRAIVFGANMIGACAAAAINVTLHLIDRESARVDAGVVGQAAAQGAARCAACRGYRRGF